MDVLATHRDLDHLFHEDVTIHLEGEVFINFEKAELSEDKQKFRLFFPDKVIPLRFCPSLYTAADINKIHLEVLLSCIANYIPFTKNGLLFFPKGDFGLFARSTGLCLTLQGQSAEYVPGEMIDIFDYSKIDRNRLDYILTPLREEKVNPLDFGTIIEENEKEGYKFLRRHFIA
jgi:hypothetical protein